MGFLLVGLTARARRPRRRCWRRGAAAPGARPGRRGAGPAREDPRDLRPSSCGSRRGRLRVAQRLERRRGGALRGAAGRLSLAQPPFTWPRNAGRTCCERASPVAHQADADDRPAPCPSRRCGPDGDRRAHARRDGWRLGDRRHGRGRAARPRQACGGPARHRDALAGAGLAVHGRAAPHRLRIGPAPRMRPVSVACAPSTCPKAAPSRAGPNSHWWSVAGCT